MLTPDETRIFAFLLKKIGGELVVSRQELFELEGWIVHRETCYNSQHREGLFRWRLKRKGVTLNGEFSHPAPDAEHLQLPSKGPQVSAPLQVCGPPVHLDVPDAPAGDAERASQSIRDAAADVTAYARGLFGEEG